MTIAKYLPFTIYKVYLLNLSYTLSNMPKTKIQTLASKHKRRNEALFDIWSVVHLLTGVVLGWLLSPFLALLIMVLWEPLEVLILSPMLARKGIVFGHESLKNSLSDIFFDVIGVALGYWVLLNIFSPPFYLSI